MTTEAQFEAGSSIVFIQLSDVTCEFLIMSSGHVTYNNMQCLKILVRVDRLLYEVPGEICFVLPNVQVFVCLHHRYMYFQRLAMLF